MTSATAFKELVMLPSSRLTIDGDMYVQDNGVTMYNQSLIDCADLRAGNNQIKLTGPTGENEKAIVMISGDIYLMKAKEFVLNEGHKVYFDWSKIASSDAVHFSSPENDFETERNNMLTLMSNFCTETTAPANLQIPKADCTGDGYNGNPTDIPSLDEVVPGFRFCYEDNFPVPGDYDFNDCVITAFPKRTGNTVKLTMSLDAVGATKQIAAGLRIKGLTESYIESASCDVDLDAGSGSSNIYPLFVDVTTPFGENVFVLSNKGKNRDNSDISDVVVRLFNDAHYAISNGSFDRSFYNTVSPSSNADVAKVNCDSRVMTFTFVLKDEEKAQLFDNSANYDVFIVENHNGKTYEVHTYPFKFDQVLGAYYGNGSKLSAYIGSSTENYPWAVCVPHSSTEPFYYPIEWNSISGSKIHANDDNFGSGDAAYKFFKQWALNKDNQADWYKTPTEGLVFKPSASNAQ